jgi:glycyl-tRNA synthetase alpha subunit
MDSDLTKKEKIEEESISSENDTNNSEKNEILKNLEEARSIHKEFEKSRKDVIEITEEDSLKLKNFNLQVMLADKNIENMDLKKNIFLIEKQEILNKISKLREDIAKRNEVNVHDYVLDLPNKRIVNRRLIKKN